MIRFALISIGFLLFFGFTDKQPPSLEFDKNIHSFGQVSQGESVAATFHFSNNGKETLKIHDIKTSCGCTAARLKNRDFGPGEKGQLEVTLNTSRLKGPVQKTVRIFSNDPDTPEFVLKLKGQVR